MTVLEATGQEVERKTRSDKGVLRLNARDSLILTWIGEQYAIRIDHLQELLGRYRTERPISEGKTGALAVSTVYNLVRRWKAAKLVDSAFKEGGKPPYVWLTSAGYKEVGLSYKEGAPSLARIRHIRSVAKVRLRLEELYPDARWVSERELWQAVNRLSERERAKIDHVPDGELHLSDGRIVVIEVELAKKTKERIRAILQGLKHRYGMDHNQSIEVWYFVNAETETIVKDVAFNPQKDGNILFTRQQLSTKKLQGGYE